MKCLINIFIKITRMGFYTEFIFTHKGVTYITCNRDGFEEFADKNIEKLVNDLLLYKDYIKNMLCFLNINRTNDESIWPVWSIDRTKGTNYCGDNMYFIKLDNNVVLVNRPYGSQLSYIISRKTKFVNFVRFLNTRFLCDKIWKKHSLPKDIINYIQNNYF